MISFLPAHLAERLQYRLMWIEYGFAANTGRDEHGVRQFYRLRFVHRTHAAFDTDLLHRYDAALIIMIGDWRIVLIGEVQDT